MIGKPGVLQSMGSQRVGHALATEQQQQGKGIRPRAEKHQTLATAGRGASLGVQGKQDGPGVSHHKAKKTTDGVEKSPLGHSFQLLFPNEHF